MIVIGLTGFAGAGKTTAAGYLVAYHGFTKLSFAAPLKKMLRTLDPALVETLDNNYAPPRWNRLSDLLSFMTEAEIKESVWGPEYRRLLQVLGTDCIRAVDDGFWVRAALRQAEDFIMEGKSRFVFDDVRFPNEGAAIRDTGSLWNISRPGLVRGPHESERYAGQLGEEFFLKNDGVPALLCRRIDTVLAEKFRI